MFSFRASYPRYIGKGRTIAYYDLRFSSRAYGYIVVSQKNL